MRLKAAAGNFVSELFDVVWSTLHFVSGKVLNLPKTILTALKRMPYHAKNIINGDSQRLISYLTSGESEIATDKAFIGYWLWYRTKEKQLLIAAALLLAGAGLGFFLTFNGILPLVYAAHSLWLSALINGLLIGATIVLLTPFVLPMVNMLKWVFYTTVIILLALTLGISLFMILSPTVAFLTLLSPVSFLVIAFLMFSYEHNEALRLRLATLVVAVLTGTKPDICVRRDTVLFQNPWLRIANLILFIGLMASIVFAVLAFKKTFILSAFLHIPSMFGLNATVISGLLPIFGALSVLTIGGLSLLLFAGAIYLFVRNFAMLSEIQTTIMMNLVSTAQIFASFAMLIDFCLPKSVNRFLCKFTDVDFEVLLYRAQDICHRGVTSKKSFAYLLDYFPSIAGLYAGCEAAMQDYESRIGESMSSIINKKAIFILGTDYNAGIYKLK